MSSKNKKIMSLWEQKINEFELKFLTTLKQTDKFDSLEQLIKSLDADLINFKGAA